MIFVSPLGLLNILLFPCSRLSQRLTCNQFSFSVLQCKFIQHAKHAGNDSMIHYRIMYLLSTIHRIKNIVNFIHFCVCWFSLNSGPTVPKNKWSSHFWAFFYTSFITMMNCCGSQTPLKPTCSPVYDCRVRGDCGLSKQCIKRSSLKLVNHVAQQVRDK